MSKYIIKNCPLFCRDICRADDTDCFCCNETDCVIKQIVELCKEENAEGEKLASIMRLSDKDTKEFLSRFASNKILELLDIKEVE